MAPLPPATPWKLPQTATVRWGNNAAGQSTPPPTVNGFDGTARALAAGDYHSCAIQVETGAVVCWGWDTDGMSTPPTSVDGTGGAANAVSLGFQHSCAIQEWGWNAVICWGNNESGQSTPPDSVNGYYGDGASAIAVGSYHSCAIQTGTDAVVCWGDDPSHLGYTQPPPSVDGTEGPARALAAGGTFTLAIPELNAAALAASALATLGVLMRRRGRLRGRS